MKRLHLVVIAAVLVGCTESEFDFSLEGTGSLAVLDGCECGVYPGSRGGFEARFTCGRGTDELVLPVAPDRAFVEGVFSPAGGGAVTVRAEVFVGAERSRQRRDVTIAQVLAPDGGRITNMKARCLSFAVDGPGAILRMGEPERPQSPSDHVPDPLAGELALMLSPLRGAMVFGLHEHPDGDGRGYVVTWLAPGIELDLTDVDGEYRALVLDEAGEVHEISPPAAALGAPLAPLPTAAPGQPAFLAERGVAVLADGEWRQLPLPIAAVTQVVAKVDANGPRAVGVTADGLMIFDGRVWEAVLGVAAEVHVGPWDDSGVRVVERPREERLCTRRIAFVGRPALLPQVELDPQATCIDVRMLSLVGDPNNGTTARFQILIDTIHGHRSVLFDQDAPALEGHAEGSGQLIRGPLVPLETIAAAPGHAEVIDIAFGSALDIGPIAALRGGLHVGWLNPQFSLPQPVSHVPWVSAPLGGAQDQSQGSFAASPDTLLVARLESSIARRWLYIDHLDLPITAPPPDAPGFPLACFAPAAGDVCGLPPPEVCVESCPRVAVCDTSTGVVRCLSEDGLAPTDPTSPIVPPDPDAPPDPDEPLEPQGNFLAGRVAAIAGQLEVALEPLDGGRAVLIEPPPDYTFDTTPERRYRLTVGTSLDDRIAPRALEVTTAAFGQDLGIASTYLSQGIELGPQTDATPLAYVASPTTGTMLVRADRDWYLVRSSDPSEATPLGLDATLVASVSAAWPFGLTMPARLAHDGRHALVPDGYLGFALVDMAPASLDISARVGTITGVADEPPVLAAASSAVLVAHLDGAARVYGWDASGLVAKGTSIADGQSLMAAGLIALAPDGARVAGFIGAEGAPEIVDLATGAIERPPLVDELGQSLPAVTGIALGADGLVVFTASSGERFVALRDGAGWETVARVPAGAALGLSSSTPTAMWVTAAGALAGLGGEAVALGALTGVAVQAGEALLVPTATRLVKIDLATGEQVNIEGAWTELMAGPGGRVVALERLATSGASGWRRVLRSDTSGVDIDKQIYHVPGEPIRLFGDLDRSLVAYATYASTGPCPGQCTTNELVPIVADANAGGVAYTIAPGFDTTFAAWGAPCVPYRRADSNLRLTSVAAGPDVVFCAR